MYHNHEAVTARWSICLFYKMSLKNLRKAVKESKIEKVGSPITKRKQ